LEKRLIADSSLLTTAYNYSAIWDRLAKRGVIVSLPTIIDRTQSLSCYQPHPERRSWPRGSHHRHWRFNSTWCFPHRWSPYAEKRWFL